MIPKYLRVRVILIFILSLEALNALPLAAMSTTVPIQRLQLAQERISANGVLISRPVAVDEKILTIVRQNQFQSVNDYAAWLTRNMVYLPDSGSAAWPEPEIFLKNRRGDCKDFASLNARVLRVLGYQPHVLAMMSKGAGHAICAFEHAGKVYWLDNAELKESNAHTLTELSRELAQEFHYTRVLEIDLPSQQTNLVYANPA